MIRMQTECSSGVFFSVISGCRLNVRLEFSLVRDQDADLIFVLEFSLVRDQDAD